MLLTNNYHMLHTGPTGTGKTLNISSLLTGGSLPDNYQYISITFSAQTSANQTQDTIDSKLEKLKRGVYGAPVGKKYIVFVDDFNMPKKEEFGAQPPLEILRQFLDHGGWYNRRDLQWIKIEGLIVLAAMGLPGGGRSRISDRIVRQFNQLGYTDLDNKTVSLMFTVLVNNFLRKFSEEVKAVIPLLIQSVLELYGKIKSELLPTPKKSHYTFNLRDISKVFQGICTASMKYNNTLESIIRVWYHENLRVFSDRLIEEGDRQFIRDSLA
jgi:dynein heavy chain